MHKFYDCEIFFCTNTVVNRPIGHVNNCHLSMNVVTQLTQFVGRDVINKNTTVRCSTGSVELS